MEHFSHYAIQQALHGILSSDTELAGMVTGIFDFVPAKTDYPYVTLGDSRATDQSTQNQRFTQLSLTLQIYSRARGRKEADQIMQRIHTLLDGAALVAEDFQIVDLRYTQSQIDLLRDGLTYLGKIQFNAFVEHL